MIETSETTRSEYLATLRKGKIVVLGTATPPAELMSCQIDLTKQEYEFLAALKGSLDDAEKIVKAIKAKIKANGS